MKIRYTFADGEISEVEVADELGGLLLDFERCEHNNNQTERRRHASLEAMDYEGKHFIDPSADIFEAMERDFSAEGLRRALETLLPQQRELLQQIFFEGITAAEIARQGGVNKSSIHKRLQRIYDHMKKTMF